MEVEYEKLSKNLSDKHRKHEFGSAEYRYIFQELKVSQDYIDDLLIRFVGDN
jgi:hypothetical protein